MGFNSTAFLLFFSGVLFVDMFLRHQGRGRKPFLLAASWFFYACWDWRFLSLIIFSTALDYVVGQKIFNCSKQANRRRWLGLSLIGNLGLLGIFKYHDFFAESLNQLLGVHLPLLNFILPIGISFYTFQTLSYTIDIYRKEITPTKSICDFALFVAFFPQLVAGPIVRAKEFLPQLNSAKAIPRYKDFTRGLTEIMSGLFKKVVIADTIGRGIVDPFYDDPSAFGSYGAILAIYAYAFQLYGDFDGYSRIAIGCARMLGFKLPENFRSPYTARTISELISRWHITLTEWIRDYFYSAMGGNRRGRTRTLFNVVMTMFLAGLWHGAGWTYPVWGLIFGLGLMVSSIRAAQRKAQGRQLSDAPLPMAWQKFATFSFWCFSGPFFRGESFEQALDVWLAILRGRGGDHADGAHTLLALVCIAWFCISPIPGQKLERAVAQLRPEFIGALLALLLGLVAVLQDSATPFIYFQF